MLFKLNLECIIQNFQADPAPKTD